VVFDDFEKFDNMSDEEIKASITTPSRQRANIINPRSAMMVPADKPKLLNKIDNLECDIALINLEDGVSPENKDRALYLASAFISNLKESNSLIVVRVNPIGEGGVDEINLLNDIKPDAIRVAKIKTRKDVESVLNILDKDIELHLSIETKEALDNLTTLKVNDRVTTVYIGILDMLESLGLPQSMLEIGNPTIDYILSKFLVDAKIAGFYPVSFTHQEYKNLDLFRKWCKYDKSIGFMAKGVISPKQTEIANDVFALSDSEIEKAEYIKEAFENSAKDGITGFSDDKYGFIDEPIYKNALLVLSMYGDK
jgi:citrate lyase subunit beta/citryl-CoA lyase